MLACHLANSLKNEFAKDHRDGESVQGGAHLNGGDQGKNASRNMITSGQNAQQWL